MNTLTNPQWRNVRLGDIGQSLIGLTYSPSNVKRSGTLVLRSSNIQDGELAFDDNVYVDCAIPEKIRIRENDILICVRNGSRRLIGKSAILDRRVSGQTFGAFMAVYRSDLNPFLRYFFQSDDFKRQIDEHLGATINQITNGSLNGFVVTLPSKSEQQAITERLQDVDRLIATLKRLISKKQAIKQGMVQQLLSGRTRLPGFIKDWTRSTAGELGVFKGGIGFPVWAQGGKSGAYPFFKVSDMNLPGNETVMKTSNNWVSENIRRRLAATVLPAGAIVFAKVGAAVYLERKRILGIPSCVDNNMAAFIPDSTQIDNRFAYYYLLSFPLSSLVAMGALPSLNSSQLRSIPFHFPEDIEEQKAIAQILQDADQEIATLERRLESARNIKQGMMQELLTGRTRLPVEEVSS
ncbi:restriction endonuclease subunit S [Corynebacterium jeikeium]|uniref:restriction endonuclease subunit S n=1 Tax=Corynebacterium jeikeium TaxID=38289 RepID=UPI000DA3F7F2|nr:restriction endonuclease subunit S [Corynebacterium jeikeium]SQI20634.1 DNA restriction-modification system, specificity subunit [Corynebacterium jeikeium]